MHRNRAAILPVPRREDFVRSHHRWQAISRQYVPVSL
jgi:hypothetical protein